MKPFILEGILTDLSCSVAAPKPWNTLILIARLHGISLVEESHLYYQKENAASAGTDQNVNETDVFNKKVRLQQKETWGVKTNTIFTCQLT